MPDDKPLTSQTPEELWNTAKKAVTSAPSENIARLKRVGNSVAEAVGWNPSGNTQFRKTVEATKAIAYGNSAQDKENKEKLATTTIDNKGSFGSLKEATIYGYQHDKKMAQIMEARQLGRDGDPLAAKTPQLKLHAVNAKIDSLLNNPELKTLTPAHQDYVLRKYYEGLVAPTLLENGIKPPPFEEWANHEDSELVKENGKKPALSTTGSFLEGTAQGFSQAAKIYANAAKVGSYLRSFEDNFLPASYAKGDRERAAKAVQQIQDYAEGVKGISTGFADSFQHTGSATEWATNFSGNVFGSLPVFIPGEKLVGAAGSTLTAGVKGAVPSIAERMVMSPGFKVAGAALSNASLMGGLALAEGKDRKAAAYEALGGAILGASLHGISATLGKAFSAIGEENRFKAAQWLRFNAAKSAIGGEAFHNSVAEAADKAEGITIEGDPSTLRSSVHPEDPMFKQAVAAEVKMRDQIAEEFFGKNKISKPEINPERQSLQDQAEYRRAQMQGFQANSRITPDSTRYRELSKERQQKVRDFIKQTTAIANDNMALVEPQVQAAATHEELLKSRKADPGLNAALKFAEQQAGESAAFIMTRAAAKEQAERLGLTTPTATLQSAVEDYEPEDGAFASLGAEYKVSLRNSTPALSSAQLTKPSTPVELFINGTIKYLEDSPNTKSGKIYFEHPEHHLLDIAENSSAPSSIKTKARKLLKAELPDLYPDNNAIKARASRLEYHKQLLRDTGHLENEGNIFRSTRLSQSPANNGTKWQKKLIPEKTTIDNVSTDSLLKRMSPDIAMAYRKLNKTLNQMSAKKISGSEGLRLLAKRKELEDIARSF